MNLTEVSSVLKQSSPKDQLILIEWLVSLTFVFLMLLLPVGYVRRRHNSPLLKLFAWGTYSAVTLLIAYIFGLMRNLMVKHELVTVWAAFLLVVYGKVATALGLSDQKSGGAYLAKQVVYITYIALMFSQISYTLYVPLILVLVFSDFLFKSKSEFISKSREYVVQDITVKSCVDRPSSERLLSKCIGSTPTCNRQASSEDDVELVCTPPLHRCQYVVDPNRVIMQGRSSIVSDLTYITVNIPLSWSEQLWRSIVHMWSSAWSYAFEYGGGDIVTVEKIWSCGEAGTSTILSSTRDPSSQLKSTCLSFSLFWLLLHKFAGVSTYESSHQQESMELVRDGIMSSKDIRPFEVIEVELAFLYDYFYNRKHLSFYKNKFWVESIRRLLFMGAIAWVVVVIFKNYHPQDQTVRIQYHEHDMDVLVTGVVILTITLLEVVQFTICLWSRWSKVSLLCTYVRRESWKNHGMLNRCINVATRVLCPVGNQLFKPWQRKLGQCSLAEYSFYLQRSRLKGPLLYLNTITGIRIATPGRKQLQAAPLTDNIKQAVIETLKNNAGQRLTPGFASLQASDQLSSQAKRKLANCFSLLGDDIEAKVVLVWHIATDFHSNREESDVVLKSDDFQVATALSRYCAHLVAFAPDMLPGNPTTTDGTCTTTIEQAYETFSSFKGDTLKKWYDKLKSESFDATLETQVNPLFLGWVLDSLLLDLITDASERWRLLARVWAEMILYLAPNAGNEWAHAERLADGGEFITHVWALLFHAGIVDRDRLSTQDVRAWIRTL